MSAPSAIKLGACLSQSGLFFALADFVEKLENSLPAIVGAGIEQVESKAVFVKYNREQGKVMVVTDNPVLSVYGVPLSEEFSPEAYTYHLNLQGGTVALTEAQFSNLESECKGKLLSTDSDGTVNLQYPFDSVSRLVEWINTQDFTLTEEEAYDFMALVGGYC